jgi:hypothetical protein
MQSYRYYLRINVDQIPNLALSYALFLFSMPTKVIPPRFHWPSCTESAASAQWQKEISNMAFGHQTAMKMARIRQWSKLLLNP